jgi:PmbA protein
MLGEASIREAANRVLAFSKAEQTEVILQTSDSALTRFANSHIHQNVATSNSEIRVRVVDGRRVGVASSNDLSTEGMKRTVKTACAMARLQFENPECHALPAPQPVESVPAVADSTVNCTPEQRAELVNVLCKKAKERGVVAAGALATTAHEIVVANTLGTFAYHPGTFADINTVMLSDTGSGYASFVHQDVREIDAEAIAQEAIDKALRSRDPVALDRGAYTVLLEEYAVVEFLSFLAKTGFSAQAMQEDRSFMSGKLGQKMMDERITIWDDGCARDGIPQPFDFEGVPKQRVTFVENGVARGVVYDTLTAWSEGRQSTGHSLPAPNSMGPCPMHMFMAPGQTPKSEMIESVERGVWVTRLWYSRVVHPMRVLITGMTRDGTFLIEDGAVTRPLKNLRFTTSCLDALDHVRAVGRETRLFHDESGASRTVPALLVDGFNFTGVTE